MKNLKYKGFTYTVIIRPWKKGKSKYEVIKYKTGFMKYLNPNIFCNYNLIYSLDQVSGTYMY